MAENKADNIYKGSIKINGTYFRVKSVFNGKIPLEKALENIVKNKFRELRSDNKF